MNMANDNFFKQRLSKHDDEKLIRIITVDIHKYDANAIKAAEAILIERKVNYEPLVADFINEKTEKLKAEIKEANRKVLYENVDEEIVRRISNGESPEMVALDLKNRNVRGIRAGDEMTSDYIGVTEKEHNSWKIVTFVFFILFIIYKLAVMFPKSPNF